MYLSTKPDGCRPDSGVSDMDSPSSSKSGSAEKKSREIGNLEYAKLWEELRQTGQGLEDVFEQSKQSAYDVKQAYDSIHQLITIKEGLKFKYYEALSTKKKFEEERDEYFQADAELIKKKDEFVEDSQKHALQHSRYVEYTKRFSKRREEYIERLLRDVERFLNQVESLSAEKQHLRKEVSDQRQEIYSLKNDMKTLKTQHDTAVQSCDKMKRELERRRKEQLWMNKKIEKLKATNQHLEEDNEELKRREQELKDELQKYVNTVDELTERRRELVERCSQLNQILKAKEEEFSREEEEREAEKKQFEDERNALENSIKDLEGQKKSIKESNQKLLRQLGQLRKKFDSTKTKGAIIEKEKNKAVLKEYHTSEKNIELASQHLELIEEVLALKKTFFEDQEKLKRGGRQYRRLEGKMNALEQQVKLLKENAKIVDPEEDAKEYREHVIRKIINAPVEDPPRYGRTYHDTVTKRHIPMIGHISRQQYAKPDLSR